MSHDRHWFVHASHSEMEMKLQHGACTCTFGHCNLEEHHLHIRWAHICTFGQRMREEGTEEGEQKARCWVPTMLVAWHHSIKQGICGWLLMKRCCCSNNLQDCSRGHIIRFNASSSPILVDVYASSSETDLFLSFSYSKENYMNVTSVCDQTQGCVDSS